MDEFDRIQAGDWLYIRTGAPMHSVMFSQWVDDARHVRTSAGGHRYRRAITYDQANNTSEAGGQRHTWKLGNAYADGIHPIHRVEAAGERAGVATTPAQLIPQTGGGASESTDMADQSGAYRTFLEARNLTVEAAIAHVRGENEAKIVQLEASRNARGEPRVAPQQADVLRATNARNHLETLVRLNERLQLFLRGAAGLDAGDQARREREEERQQSLPAGQTASEYETTHIDVRAGDDMARNEFDRGNGGLTTGDLSKVQAPFPQPVPRAARTPR
jgi:hypothetical protein